MNHRIQIKYIRTQSHTYRYIYRYIIFARTSLPPPFVGLIIYRIPLIRNPRCRFVKRKYIHMYLCKYYVHLYTHLYMYLLKSSFAIFLIVFVQRNRFLFLWQWHIWFIYSEKKKTKNIKYIKMWKNNITVYTAYLCL